MKKDENCLSITLLLLVQIIQKQMGLLKAHGYVYYDIIYYLIAKVVLVREGKNVYFGEIPK